MMILRMSSGRPSTHSRAWPRRCARDSRREPRSGPPARRTRAPSCVVLAGRSESRASLRWAAAHRTARP
ncbi:hypothetical protein VTK73DRAFT_6310 [Phialemonium thermophilum]|uniref:Uncharacterized protein n=1 Tax=Phialemonium thermophilum TaxID=223376 RepID=A0ABR3UZP3_9PEZI